MMIGMGAGGGVRGIRLTFCDETEGVFFKHCLLYISIFGFLRF
jgi:hypothetical protein